MKSFDTEFLKFDYNIFLLANLVLETITYKI